MGILKAIFGNKDIEIEQLEILFHTEAAYFGEHGRIIASNRALGIVEREVIFCLKGHTTPLPLNHRLFAHIWKEAQAQGFIPLELAKYGKVVENAADTDPVAAHRRVLAILREHGQAPEIAEMDRVMHRLDVNELSTEQAAAAVAQAGKSSARDFSNVDVPTFLRQGKKEGEDGFQTSGFVAATTRG